MKKLIQRIACGIVGHTTGVVGDNLVEVNPVSSDKLRVVRVGNDYYYVRKCIRCGEVYLTRCSFGRYWVNKMSNHLVFENGEVTNLHGFVEHDINGVFSEWDLVENGSIYLSADVINNFFKDVKSEFESLKNQLHRRTDAYNKLSGEHTKLLESLKSFNEEVKNVSKINTENVLVKDSYFGITSRMDVLYGELTHKGYVDITEKEFECIKSILILKYGSYDKVRGKFFWLHGEDNVSGIRLVKGYRNRRKNKNKS